MAVVSIEPERFAALTICAVGTDDRSTGELFAAGVEGGDQQSWNALVARLSPAIWGAARSFELSEQDAKDVFQTVWLRLVDRRSTIRNPEALAGWIQTTARNEARALLRKSNRADPVGEVPEAPVSPESLPENQVEAHFEKRLLWLAFRELSDICQQVLRLLSSQVKYREVADILDIPIGSVSDRRKQCLVELRGHLGSAIL